MNSENSVKNRTCPECGKSWQGDRKDEAKTVYCWKCEKRFDVKDELNGVVISPFKAIASFKAHEIKQ